jgi:hypothetical protein
MNKNNRECLNDKKRPETENERLVKLALEFEKLIETYTEKIKWSERWKKQFIESQVEKLSKKDFSPIAFQKALETAIDRQAKEWRQFQDLSHVELSILSEYSKKRQELANNLRRSRRKLKELKRETEHRTQLCDIHQMPPVPTPQFTREHWAAHTESFAGVYVAFSNGLVQYVGESQNIPQRMKSHHAIQMDWLVSVIPMAAHERFFAESFYIWLLRPPINKEGAKTIKAGSQKRMNRFDEGNHSNGPR